MRQGSPGVRPTCWCFNSSSSFPVTCALSRALSRLSPDSPNIPGQTSALTYYNLQTTLHGTKSTDWVNSTQLYPTGRIFICAILISIQVGVDLIWSFMVQHPSADLCLMWAISFFCLLPHFTCLVVPENYSYWHRLQDHVWIHPYLSL